jgi:hypothetical protein
MTVRGSLKKCYYHKGAGFAALGIRQYAVADNTLERVIGWELS